MIDAAENYIFLSAQISNRTQDEVVGALIINLRPSETVSPSMFELIKARLIRSYLGIVRGLRHLIVWRRKWSIDVTMRFRNKYLLSMHKARNA